MKNLWRRIAVICSILMCMLCLLDGISISGAGILVAQAATELQYRAELQEGDLVEAVLSTEEMDTRTAIYKFVPKETDIYEFYSVSNTATCAYMYNSNGMIVKSDLTGSGRGGNFVLQCDLVAGDTYYFSAQFARSASEEGTILVGIRRMTKTSDFADVPVLTVQPQGVECNIAGTNDVQRFCFIPEKTALYNIFTGSSCGAKQEVNCTCTDCTCLQDTAITLYVEEGGKLETFGYGVSGGAMGALVRTTFNEGQVYYIEVTSEDQMKSGACKLYLNTDLELGGLPLKNFPVETTVENILEDNTESLYYQVQVEKTGIYRFHSQYGQNLYMTLYDSQMQRVQSSNEYEDNFDLTVTLKQDEAYYLQLNTLSTTTFAFEMMLQYQKEEEKKPSETDPKKEPQNKKTAASAIGTATLGKIANKVYDGKAKKPSVVLTKGKNKLVKGKDYQISYKNNKKIGTASVVIKGIGNYTGSRTATFKIVPAKVTIKKAKRSGKKLKLSWKKVKGAGGYEVSYSTSKKFKKAKVWKGKKGSKIKVTVKLKNKKKYFVRIRAYKAVKGKKYYGAYSKKKKC